METTIEKKIKPIQEKLTGSLSTEEVDILSDYLLFNMIKLYIDECGDGVLESLLEYIQSKISIIEIPDEEDDDDE